MMSKFSILFKVLYYRLLKLVLNTRQYAKYRGVSLGTDNMIADYDHWGTEPYLIKIGNNCQLTHGCKLFTHGGANVVRNKYPDFDVFGKIIIGNWVYIGTTSLIMPGVTIGNNVLVAAGSVVTKSIPSNSVVAGNPARIICTVDEYYNRNKQYNIHTKGLSFKAKKEKLMAIDEIFYIKK